MPEHTSGVEAWKKHTSAWDRVQSVATTVSQPRSVAFIADEAHVGEKTVRTHLERLVALNVLLKTERNDETLYAPDPLYTRMQTLRDLLEEHDRDELIELKAKLQSQIEEWEADDSVASPSELRAHVPETDTASQTRELKTTANEWELAQYRLSILEDAIEHYALYSQDVQESA